MTLFDFFILKILFAKLAGFNISAFPPSLFIAFTKLADVIFVAICLANQTGINLSDAFEKKLKDDLTIDLLAQFSEALRKKYKITINDDVIDQLN